MKKPHILVANIFFAPYTYGGATIVAEEVARSLVRRHDWRITAFSAMSRPDVPDYAIRKMQNGDITNYVINLPPLRSYAQMYSNIGVAEAMSRLIRTIAPDLLHVHCIQELGTGILSTARQAGVPVILSAHDYWWICERQFMIKQDGSYCGQDPVRIDNCRTCSLDISRAQTRFLHLANVASKVDLLTYPSQFALDLSRRSGITPKQDAVWANGVTLPGMDFFEAQRARRAHDPRTVFGFCGGPSALKGWPQIRGAFAGLGRKDFKVRLADGSRDGSWWKKINLAALPGEWEVYPRYDQSEMDRFWTGIDVLLFPSQWKETFGLTIREALARGIRVIQTDSGGTTEHDGPDRDRMFKIGDGPEVLQAEIERALEHPSRQTAPVRVDGFDDQADRFIELASPLLGGQNEAGNTTSPSRYLRQA